MIRGKPTSILRILCLAAPVFLSSIFFNAQADDMLLQFKGYGGDNSCAWWMLSPNHKVAGNMFLLGFFSGANMWNPFDHQVGTDAAGIYAEVAQACAGQPSRSLAEAAMEVYNRQMMRVRRGKPLCVPGEYRIKFPACAG